MEGPPKSGDGQASLSATDCIPLDLGGCAEFASEMGTIVKAGAFSAGDWNGLSVLAGLQRALDVLDPVFRGMTIEVEGPIGSATCAGEPVTRRLA